MRDRETQKMDFFDGISWSQRVILSYKVYPTTCRWETAYRVFWKVANKATCGCKWWLFYSKEPVWQHTNSYQCYLSYASHVHGYKHATCSWSWLLLKDYDPSGRARKADSTEMLWWWKLPFQVHNNINRAMKWINLIIALLSHEHMLGSQTCLIMSSAKCSTLPVEIPILLNYKGGSVAIILELYRDRHSHSPRMSSGKSLKTQILKLI